MCVSGCSGEGPASCVQGEVAVCSCPNGSQAQQTCQDDRRFEPCRCGNGGTTSCIVGETASCTCPFGGLSQQVCGGGGLYGACDCGLAGNGSGGAGGGSGGMGGTGGMTAPPGTPGVAVANPQDEAAFIWDDTQLLTYELQIAPNDLSFLDSAPADEIYVPGTLTYNGQSYPVGVRYKGSVGGYVGCVTGGGGLSPLSTAGSKTCPKLSMKLSFNWMMDGGRFFGLKKLQFHSMNSDASMMRDRLGYSLFRDMGIASPRAVHARLVINGQYEGLFVNVEQIDSRFTRAHFTDGGDGNLYKEVWPKWTNGPDYMAGLRTNETDPNLSFDRVVRFSQQVQAAAGPMQTLGVASQWMDMNYVYDFIAVDRAIVHDDGMFHWYCGGGLAPVATGNNPGNCSNHNYYVYEGQSADYLWLVPWDLDLAFGGETSFIPIVNAWNDVNAQCPSGGVSSGGISPNQMPPACDKLTAGWASDPAGYKAAIQRLLAGPFSQVNVNGKLDAWSAQISSAVDEQYQNLGGGQNIPSTSNWQNAVNQLRNYIDNRRNVMQGMAN